MRQLVHTMFIANDHNSFHLWWQENFVKHQKVLKYYDQDCLKNFLLLFMSLLSASIVKNSHFCDWTLLNLSKKRRRPTFKGLNTKFGPQWEGRKSSYQRNLSVAILSHTPQSKWNFHLLWIVVIMCFIYFGVIVVNLSPSFSFKWGTME